MIWNQQDVEILIKRMHGRCRAGPQYGTMLPALLDVCMTSDLPILDVGLGYYTSVVLHYLYGDRVVSSESYIHETFPRIISFDGMDRRIDPMWLIPGSIWVLHDCDDDYCQQAVGLLEKFHHRIVDFQPRTLVACIK